MDGGTTCSALLSRARSEEDAVGTVAPRSRPRRDLAALHPSVLARYTALAAAVAPDVEAGLSPAVAANRVRSCSVDPPEVRLAPWRTERAAFAARLRDLAAQAPCLLFADVRDCYGAIRPSVVERSLRTLGCSPERAGRLAEFLETLEGVRGLPIGPDPSAVLANAVLAGVDRALQARGVRHLRWVDDVVVSVASGPAAGDALQIVEAALAPLGLELNGAKTRVFLDPGAARHLGTFSDVGGGLKKRARAGQA